MIRIAAIMAIAGIVIYPCYYFAQNLVPNYSFENYSSCPTNLAQLYKAIPWFNPTGNTADYFNACYTDTITLNGIPYNVAGYQYARTGNGYAGVTTFYGTPDGRDYIEVKLLDSLIAGRKYCVGFYIARSNTLFATDVIGAYLSQDSAIYPSLANMPYIPQIENPFGNVLMDSANWVLISGEYIAQGGEQFITIGNFRTDSNTTIDSTVSDTSTGSWSYDAYYYIDDVSLVRCDCNSFPTAKFGFTTDTLKVNFTDATTGAVNYWQWDFGDGTSTSSAQNPVHTYDSSGTYSVMLIACDSGCCDTAVTSVTVGAVGVGELQNENYKLQIYPNPAGDKIYFSNNFSVNTITIINILGQKMYSGKFEKELDVSFLPVGVYVIEVAAQQKIFRAKFVKD